MQVIIGSKLTMHYALRLTDGLVADSSFDHEPLTFTVGDGTLDDGLELALVGLRQGDQQTLTLMPGQAFGAHDDDAIQFVSRKQFPTDIELEPGQIMGFNGPQGTEVPGTIVAIEDNQVQVDFNHPLAGREIIFEVEILSIENPETE